MVSDLRMLINENTSGKTANLVENILKFSAPEERENLAFSYLSQDNSFETRIAILTTLHTGTVKPNSILKQALFEIAQNVNDPLNRHARDTLLSAFEIDNNEYRRLRGSD